jgi:hypothetical protein
MKELDHDLVLQFLLPNLPRQDTSHFAGSCSEQSDNFLAIHRHRFCVVPFHVPFLLRDALVLQELLLNNDTSIIWIFFQIIFNHYSPLEKPENFSVS